MGKANRERRRRKEHREEQARRTPPSGAAPHHSAQPRRESPQADTRSAREQLTTVIAAAMAAFGDDAQAVLPHLAARLAAEPSQRQQTMIDQVLESMFRSLVAAAWRSGWQPSDVIQHVERRLRAPHSLLAGSLVAAELTGYAADTVDPRWAEQLADAGAKIWWPAELTAVQACGRAHHRGRADFLTCALELLHELTHLPRLQVLGPLPGTAVPGSAAQPRPQADERVLARVRALLAKAESTTFPAEAETFTAGAQALMARHAIDHAMLAAAAGGAGDEPGGRRIWVDPPYEAPKMSLLGAVARANRCQSVWTKQLGFVTVVGYPTDVDAVEVLFTSLLVQAIHALNRASRTTYRDSAGGTRTFRQSFLVAYAHRIHERLSAATRDETEQAAARLGKDALLPVLASREHAVREVTDELFASASLRPVRTSARDAAGWAAGRAAADLASLSRSDALPG